MEHWSAEHRQAFPVTKRWIYFNHAATAPYSLWTAEALHRYIQDYTENGDLNYEHWGRIREETRGLAARLLHCKPSEIALTAHTSEGANIVAQGLGFSPGDNLVIPAKDFPANVHPWLNLERKGIEVRQVPQSMGRWRTDDLLERVDSRTRLVAVSSVAYHNGSRTDLAGLGRALEPKGIPLYVDAIQSLGILPLDVERCRIAFLSADGHKWMLGPEGAALFFCASSWLDRIRQAYVSWLSVQDPFRFDSPSLDLAEGARRFECGAFHMLGIVGLHASLEKLLEIGIDRIQRRVLDLNHAAALGLRSKGYRILSPLDEAARSGILTFDHPELDVQTLHGRLEAAAVVMTLRGGGVRISPHFYNNEEEVVRFLEALP